MGEVNESKPSNWSEVASSVNQQIEEKTKGLDIKKQKITIEYKGKVAQHEVYRIRHTATNFSRLDALQSKVQESANQFKVEEYGVPKEIRVTINNEESLWDKFGNTLNRIYSVCYHSLQRIADYFSEVRHEPTVWTMQDLKEITESDSAIMQNCSKLLNKKDFEAVKQLFDASTPEIKSLIAKQLVESIVNSRQKDKESLNNLFMEIFKGDLADGNILLRELAEVKDRIPANTLRPLLESCEEHIARYTINDSDTYKQFSEIMLLFNDHSVSSTRSSIVDSNSDIVRISIDEHFRLHLPEQSPKTPSEEVPARRTTEKLEKWDIEKLEKRLGKKIPDEWEVNDIIAMLNQLSSAPIEGKSTVDLKMILFDRLLKQDNREKYKELFNQVKTEDKALMAQSLAEHMKSSGENDPVKNRQLFMEIFRENGIEDKELLLNKLYESTTRSSAEARKFVKPLINECGTFILRNTTAAEQAGDFERLDRILNKF